MFKHFTEAELITLITDQIEENLHLEYKGADSLLKTDLKKREISKDVSAIANSDGGTIIYGMREFDDTIRRHLPERIDPIERNNISKEWLEQVINSNIQPKISDLVITPIQLSSSINHVSYVVTISKSNTAHQASDKKYYKRYNFESVAMDDYEIKDIINRQSNPILHLVVNPEITTFEHGLLTIPLVIMNSSIKMAKDVKLTFQINEESNCSVISFPNLTDISSLNPGKRLFNSTLDVRIYKGLSIRIGSISLRFINDTSKVTFTSTIYADNMEPIIDTFGIEIVNNQIQYFTI